jgi:hypothetical protein
MTHLFQLQIFAWAMLGFLISLLWHLGNAYSKVVQKEEDRFNWGFYFRKNIVDILKGYVGTIAALTLVPLAMEQFGAASNWFKPMAILFGIYNIQIVVMGKRLFEKGFKNKTGESFDDTKSE